jgi:hypothetical protein
VPGERAIGGGDYSGGGAEKRKAEKERWVDGREEGKRENEEKRVRVFDRKSPPFLQKAQKG